MLEFVLEFVLEGVLEFVLEGVLEFVLEGVPVGQPQEREQQRPGVQELSAVAAGAPAVGDSQQELVADPAGPGGYCSSAQASRTRQEGGAVAPGVGQARAAQAQAVQQQQQVAAATAMALREEQRSPLAHRSQQAVHSHPRQLS